MREIKFRGKTPQGEWVYGFYVERDGYNKGMIYDTRGVGHDVDKKTVGQFTGVILKKVELFVGDILCWRDDSGEVQDYYEVVWHDNGFKARWIGGAIESFEDLDDDFEYTGNRFDDKDLLE